MHSNALPNTERQRQQLMQVNGDAPKCQAYFGASQCILMDLAAAADAAARCGYSLKKDGA